LNFFASEDKREWGLGVRGGPKSRCRKYGGSLIAKNEKHARIKELKESEDQVPLTTRQRGLGGKGARPRGTAGGAFLLLKMRGLIGVQSKGRNGKRGRRDKREARIQQRDLCPGGMRRTPI